MDPGTEDPIETTVLLLDYPSPAPKPLSSDDVGQLTSSYISQPPSTSSSSSTPAHLLLDAHQPFTFGVRFSNVPYRINFYDTASPVDWRTLKPNVVILCYAVSQRLSLINITRYVSTSMVISSKMESSCGNGARNPDNLHC
ncbi:hypothetical protein CJF30_00002052 [Rutstroemia sp. NJR-2017a BBW]|nr:hypothetical protein CJF30_00002052 [Rutstroemia sp. NJR-2017a BBW]